MLPHVVFLYTGGDGNTLHWSETDRKVLDTELLHICWLINDQLTTKERLQYNSELMEYGNAKDNGRFALNGGFNAPWQARTIALAKVKGITI